jgi:hypothetical protein
MLDELYLLRKQMLSICNTIRKLMRSKKYNKGISKNPCFDRSYESDTTVGVVRPQPLPLPPAAGKREGSAEFLEMP